MLFSCGCCLLQQFDTYPFVETENGKTYKISYLVMHLFSLLGPESWPEVCVCTMYAQGVVFVFPCAFFVTTVNAEWLSRWLCRLQPTTSISKPFGLLRSCQEDRAQLLSVSASLRSTNADQNVLLSLCWLVGWLVGWCDSWIRCYSLSFDSWL